MECCGWYAPEDWMKNKMIHENSSVNLYPCSCKNTSAFLLSGEITGSANRTAEAVDRSGFCPTAARDKWPVYQTLFVMTLSMCLCRNLDQNYNKLARYS
ncbi:leukocyte antigen CD37-like [Hyperolius riggenbachi]|uniref:leukocyte antigen CD37-like n=1 Tax=Hyperolius riggenbachi TaxID=752182 RepID=UPI0035A392FE